MEKNPGLKHIVTGLLVLLLAFNSVEAQKKEKMPVWEVRKGTLRFQGNLAPGYLFWQKDITAYVTGDIDYYIDDRISAFGSIWASFNMGNDPKGLYANHALFSGVNYHFLSPRRIDPYVGFMPGLGLVRAGYTDTAGNLHKTGFTPIPLMSAAIGFNYYIGSIFHFYAKAQFTAGQIFSTLPSEKRVDELKFTVGLGWNARVWWPKTRDKWKPRKPRE